MEDWKLAAQPKVELEIMSQCPCCRSWLFQTHLEEHLNSCHQPDVLEMEDWKLAAQPKVELEIMSQCPCCRSWLFQTHLEEHLNSCHQPDVLGSEQLSMKNFFKTKPLEELYRIFNVLYCEDKNEMANWLLFAVQKRLSESEESGVPKKKIVEMLKILRNAQDKHYKLKDGYRILVEETFLWSVWAWLVGHQAWILSILASLVVGLSGIFPLLVIPIEEGANLKTGAAARTLRVLLSFAVGGLLGDVFLHLLPEAWAAAETPTSSASTLGGRRARPSMTPGLWVLAGILLFTVLEMMCSELNADRDDEDETNHDKLAAGNTNGAAPSVGNGFLAPNGHLFETNGDLHVYTKDHVTSNGGSHVSTKGHVTSNGGSHVSTNGHVASNGHVTPNGGSHMSTNGHVTSNGASHVPSNGHVASNGHVTPTGGSHMSTNGHATSNGASHVSTNGHVASNGHVTSNGSSNVASNGQVSTKGCVKSNGHLAETNGGAHSPQPTSHILPDETIFSHVPHALPVNFLGHSESSSEYAASSECSQLTNGAVTQAANRRPSKFGLPPVKQVAGYLNLLANSIDNFMHGLAVGGGFLVSVKMGTLTTLAILIHEVPHEIGDFAILLRAGFTRWEAARAQLYTAGSGLLGALTAVACSTSSVESRTSWVVPFTAGGFLHIALVTVLPELLAERDRWESAKQVIGLLTGMLVMMVLTACFD